MVCLNDNSIGPAVRGCRAGFDFTVYFEQVAFVIVPASIFIALSLVDLPRLLYRKQVVEAPLVRLFKQLFAISFSILKLVVLAIGVRTWSKTSISQTITIAAASLDFISALIILPLSWLNHARSPRPSILLGFYLAVTLLFDIVSIRTSWLVSITSGQITYSRLITATAVLKAALLVSESLQKDKWLIWDRKDVSPEETSGIYSLGVFGWLNRLFIKGYRGILTMESLYPLDEALLTETLGGRFMEELKNRPLNGKKWKLLWRVLYTLRVPILLPIIPRLALLASNFCQPLLIEALLNYLQEENKDKNHGYGLIFATALTYGCIAISTALYAYLQQRYTVMMRGCLVHAVYDKTTHIKTSQANDANVITIMSTDVDNAVDGLYNMHEYWANIVQVAIACWLLYGHLGIAFVAPIGVVIVAVLAAAFVGSLVGPRQKAWMEAIELRVGVTANAIGQMKLIKMAGMTKPVKKAIQSLRVKEIRVGGRWRIVIGAAAIIAQLPVLVSPVVTLAVTSTTLDTTTIFVSLSYLTLMANPLSMVFQNLASLIGDLACMQRIQGFLESPVHKDYRQMHGTVKQPLAVQGDEVELGIMRSELQEVTMKMQDASFGWQEGKDVLKNVNVTVTAAQLTIVAGPVASGKTTFCKALLGEMPFAKGLTTLSSGSRIAYCDQQPFLSNTSLQKNIIGYAPFSQSRYSRVIKATMLHVDFETFPEGDKTIIGSGGIALSGGQRQRVSIARALYLTGVDLLMFDDVLSGLDVNTEEHLFRHIFAPGGLARENGAAVVLCTHNLRHVSAADRVITLSTDGTVTEKEQTSITVSELSSLLKTVTSASDQVEAPQSLPANELPALATLATDDQARQLGDSTVYKHYFSAVGIGVLIVFFGSGVVYGFLANFPKVWLSYWSEDTDRGSNAKHSQAYYMGIFGMLQACCVLAFITNVYTVVCAIIRQTGTVLHEQTIETVVNAPLRFFTTTDTGLVTNYFSQDLNLIDTTLPISMINLSLDLTAVVGMAAVLASSSPWLALTYPVLLSILWLIQKFYLRTSRQMRLLDLEAKSPLYSHFLDTVKGLTTIRAFGWEGESIRHNVALLNESQRPYYLLLMIQRWLHLTLNLVVLITATGLVALITQLKAGAGLSGASLVTLMSLSEQLMGIVRNYVELETSIGAVARLRSFSAKTASESTDDANTPKESWPAEGRIDMSGVWASYTNSTSDYAIQALDMTIQPGEKVAICGRTGSGKSSTVLLLLGLLNPMYRNGTSCKISIDDVPLNTIDRHILRERLITVPQDPVFLPSGSTVAQNLDPLDEATPDQCASVLRDVGLWHVMEDMGGLGAELDETALSQGQRQLFNLARAVLKRRTSQRSLLLLDEFTASVDADTERGMLKLVEQEFKGCTIVMISHRLDMVLEMFDMVMVMDKGMLVETGSPQVLRDTEGSRFAKLVEAASPTP